MAERGESLRAALKIINGERLDQYGCPEDNFGVIADHWNATLKQLIQNRLHESSALMTEEVKIQVACIVSDLLSPLNVAQMMALYKHSRQLTGAGKTDNYDDQAGYVGIAGDIFRASMPDEQQPDDPDCQKKSGVIR